MKWRDIAQALRRLHVSYGIVRDENLGDLKQYEVLLAGSPATAVSADVLAAVRAWLRKGGKLILMPRAFSKNELLRPTDAVRTEMEKAAVARLDDLPRYNAVPGDSTDWPTCLKMYDAALTKAGVKTPASLEAPGGILDTSDLAVGLLKGKGYWLVGIASFDEKDRTVTLRLNDLPAGSYEIVDVTGERPLIKPDKQAGYALKHDPASRYAKVLAKSISSADLKRRGMPQLKVQSGMARILLIRGVNRQVIVSCPEYEVRTIALRNVGVDIVLPEDPGKLRNAANRLITAIRQHRGAPRVRVVGHDEVTTEDVRYEAILHPQGVNWEHKINVFNNAPLATKHNLICIGSEETHPIIKHLGAPGTFTYDKVLEKVTKDYPGRGRGLIGVVESVNDPSFDPTDQTRDALILGGSDDAGTIRAIDRAVEILNARNR